MLIVTCRHCGWKQKTNATKTFKCVRCEKANKINRVIKKIV